MAFGFIHFAIHADALTSSIGSAAIDWSCSHAQLWQWYDCAIQHIQLSEWFTHACVVCLYRTDDATGSHLLFQHGWLGCRVFCSTITYHDVDCESKSRISSHPFIARHLFWPTLLDGYIDAILSADANSWIRFYLELAECHIYGVDSYYTQFDSVPDWLLPSD